VAERWCGIKDKVGFLQLEGFLLPSDSVSVLESGHIVVRLFLFIFDFVLENDNTGA